MTLATSAVRGAAATYGAQAVKAITQVASVIVLARLLSPSEYGVVTMVLAIVGVATVFGDMGLSMAAMQSQNLSQQQRSNLLWINAALGCVLGAIIAVSAPLVAAFYGKPELRQVAESLAVVFVLYALIPQFRAEMASRFSFKWLAVSDASAQAVAFLVAVVLAANGLGYWALVWNQIVAAVVTLALIVIGARWKPNLPRSAPGMKPLLRYGVDTLGVQLLTYVSSNLDNILIGKVFGSGTLGLYSRASQLFRLPLQQIATPLTPVAIPVMSRLQSEPARFEEYSRRAQLVLAYGLGAVLFMLIAAAEPFVSVALGKQWAGAAQILQILALGGVFQVFGYVYYWVFLALGQTRLQLKWSLIGRIAMMLMMLASLPLGVVGIATAVAAGQVLLWVLNTFCALPRTAVRPFPLVVAALRPGLIFGTFAACSLVLQAMFPPTGPVVALWLNVMGAAFALLLAWLCSRHVRDDLRAIAQTVARLRK
ncbi:lipopolysaccharide biosynthesis protein [Curtobacterium sp. RHCKG23]|uniref:Lipopolysaccharide biosynthesis protein n=1 Tax=Curtobacterium citri TaxID=3055139 RepID=A0ABT7T9D8_9MICO|nr:lipopolysaccharide biosynthesis protein [Curtobacterium citri]MDM7886167.1 lipopolysaccharide biosynthesis protein [Curtobacterium citri]